MASRYPIHKKFDYCLHPILVHTAKGIDYVPCGYCSGCLLHKSNEWCQRLSAEIENFPHSFTFTLTYSNKYLPVLVRGIGIDGNPAWTSDHSLNIRYDGTKDVSRDEFFEHKECPIDTPPVPVTNMDGDFIPYASKRDIQLFLKTCNKRLKDYDSSQRFRYFIISEYGETKFRPHYHCIFFCFSKDASETLIREIIYPSWQMCDYSRFRQYCSYCDSRASSYLTQYINSVTLLPYIYQTKDFLPFRLASKNPAIGYSSFNRKEVLEKAIVGDIEYHRAIPSVSKPYIFRYSSQYTLSNFPKCQGFSRFDFHRLLRVYGTLYYAVERWHQPYDECALLLRSNLGSQDWNATRKCYQFTGYLRDLGYVGDLAWLYVHALDLVYYKRGMAALKMQYEWQELNGLTTDIFGVYTNLRSLVAETSSHQVTLDEFFAPFGICPNDLSDIDYREWIPANITDDYLNELDDIFANMVKLPKLKENVGLSPNSVYY